MNLFIERLDGITSKRTLNHENSVTSISNEGGSCSISSETPTKKSMAQTIRNAVIALWQTKHIPSNENTITTNNLTRNILNEWKTKCFALLEQKRTERDSVITIIEEKQNNLLGSTQYLLEELKKKKSNIELKTKAFFTLQKWKKLFLGSKSCDTNENDDDDSIVFSSLHGTGNEENTHKSSNQSCDTENCDSSTTASEDYMGNITEEKSVVPSSPRTDEDSFARAFSALMDTVTFEEAGTISNVCTEPDGEDVLGSDPDSPLDIDIGFVTKTGNKSLLAIDDALQNAAKMLDAALSEDIFAVDTSSASLERVQQEDQNIILLKQCSEDNDECIAKGEFKAPPNIE